MNVKTFPLTEKCTILAGKTTPEGGEEGKGPAETL
jgi:hypothetical protein